MNVTLHLGDCLEYMRGMDAASVDAVITDPPYPDIDKGFTQTPIDALERFDCRQLVFWSAAEYFPLDWTSIHIWHKPNGNSSQHYERIFERNGNHVYRVYRYAAILPNYVQYAKECVNHPTQKPLRLMMKLIEQNTRQGDTILDPFMGSGTTGVACVKLGRNFIGCEINPDYYKIAERRIAEAQLQIPLDMGQTV